MTFRASLLSLSIFVIAALAYPGQIPAQDHCTADHSRCLVIDAQDLGMAASVDKASTSALENDSLSAAGLLVPGPWFPEVVRWSRAHPNADIGIQLDLNAEWASYRWRPVSAAQPGSGLADPAGYLPNDARYIAQHAKPEDVATEFRAQIAAAKQAGLVITHLDSHGGIEFYTPWLFKEYWKAAQEAGLPAVLSKDWVRQRGRPTPNPNVFDVGGTQVDLADVPFNHILAMQPGVSKENWLKAYENMLTGLPPGVYLLQVHLGFNDEELQAMTVDHPNWGAQWRQNDYDVITNPAFHKLLKDQGFILIGWKDLKKIMAERKAAEAAHQP